MYPKNCYQHQLNGFPFKSGKLALYCIFSKLIQLLAVQKFHDIKSCFKSNRIFNKMFQIFILILYYNE